MATPSEPKKKSGAGLKQTLRDVKAEFQAQAAKKITIHLNNEQSIDLRLKSSDTLSDVLSQVGKKKNITLDGAKYAFKRTQDEESTLKNDTTIAAFKLAKKELFLVPPLSSLVAAKVFGAALVVGSRRSTAAQGLKFHYYPRVLEQCFEFLDNDLHMSEIGLFRLSGSKPEIDKYREMFDSGQDFEFPKSLDPHIVTGLFKLYLRELPEPLMTFDLYDKFLGLFSTCKFKEDDLPSPQELETTMQETATFLSEMPSEHYFVLEYVLRFFKKLLRFQEVNKMTASNLGVVLGPSFFRPRTPTIESMTKHTPILAKATSFMISQYDVLFEDFASMEASGIPALSPKGTPSSPATKRIPSTSRDEPEGLTKTKTLTETMINGMTDATQLRQLLLERMREKETSDRQHAETVARLQEQIQELTRKSQADTEHLQQQIKELTASFEEQLANAKQALEQQAKLSREESEAQKKYFQAERDKNLEDIATLRRQAEQKDLLIRELNAVRKKQLEKATADLTQKQTELVNEYREKIVSLEKELELSQSNIKVLEQSRQKLVEEIAALNNKIKELNEERERQLKRQEETLGAKIEYEKQTSAQMRSKIADLDKEIAALNREKQALSNQLAASKKDLENQKTKFNQQLENERQSFKQKMLKMEVERTEAERDLRAEIAEKYEQEKRISEKERQRIQELTAQLELSRNETSIANNIVNMLKAELAEATKGAESVKGNDTATKEIERLKQQIAEKERQIQELSNSLNAVKKELEQLKLQLADKDKQQSTASSSSKKDIDQMKKQIEEKDRQLQDLTNTSNLSKKELEQLKKQLEDNARQIRELTASNAALKKDAEKSQRDLSPTVSFSKKESEQTKQQLAEKEKQIRELTSAVGAAKKEIEQLQQQLEKTRGNSAAVKAEQQIADLKKERDGLNAQIAELNSRLSSQTSRVHELQTAPQDSSNKQENARVAQLTGEIRLLRSQVSSDQRNFEKQLKEQKDLVSKLQAAANTNTSNASQIRRLEEQIAQDKKSHEEQIQSLRQKLFHQSLMNVKLNTFANFSVTEMVEAALSENVDEDNIHPWLIKKLG